MNEIKRLNKRMKIIGLKEYIISNFEKKGE